MKRHLIQIHLIYFLGSPYSVLTPYIQGNYIFLSKSTHTSLRPPKPREDFDKFRLPNLTTQSSSTSPSLSSSNTKKTTPALELSHINAWNNSISKRLAFFAQNDADSFFLNKPLHTSLRNKFKMSVLKKTVWKSFSLFTKTTNRYKATLKINNIEMEVHFNLGLSSSGKNRDFEFRTTEHFSKIKFYQLVFLLYNWESINKSKFLTFFTS